MEKFRQEGRPALGPFALMLDQPVLVEDGGWSGIGAEGVPIHIRADGGVIFDFAKVDVFAAPGYDEYEVDASGRQPVAIVAADDLLTQVTDKRLVYMNAWMGAYMSAMLEVLRHGIHVPAPTAPMSYLKAFKMNDRWVLTGSDGNPREGQTQGVTVTHPVFDYAVQSFMSAEAAFGANYAMPLAMLHQATYHYHNHRFSNALVDAWTLCEQTVNIIWRRYQDEVSSGPAAVTTINKDRRKLLNGRDYTASVKSQVLSLAGRIPDQLLTALDDARRERNDFMHNQSMIGASSAGSAISTSAMMLSLIVGMKFGAPLMYSRWY